LRQARATPSSAQVDMATAKCAALLQAIVDLKASLKAIIADQSAARAHQTAPEARNKKARRCKFCGGVGHIIKACNEADEYVLARKCTRDPSGRILLPCGAEVPQETNGKTIRERCDELHRQNPSIQVAAARSHKDDTADQASSVPQEARHAAPLEVRETSLMSNSKHPTARKESARPHSTSTGPEDRLQVPKRQICTCTDAVAETAAPQCTHRRLADIIGASLPSSECTLKVRGQERDRYPAVLAREEVHRQCKRLTTCAMSAHASEFCIQGRNHLWHRRTYLQVPRQRAR
jgi:hypothetical protein